jgi:hypothetical protein
MPGVNVSDPPGGISGAPCLASRSEPISLESIALRATAASNSATGR